MNVGAIFFILFALVSIASIGYSIKGLINIVKKKNELNRAFLVKNAIISGVFAVSFTAMLLFIYAWNNITPKASEVLCTVFGGLLFGLLATLSLSCFVLHYYGKIEDRKFDRNLFKILAISFPLMFVFLFLTTNGFADYCVYPLVNGLSFSEGFVNPDNGRPNIAFYAICILTGAIYTYLICDHKFYVEYGKHGILESLFLVAFPAGIIGARIFYVVGNWHEFSGKPIGYIFDMTQGGLTILGGAIMGIVVGVAWFLWRKRQYSIWVAVDIIVPTILIAQGVGRWGNFFNCEVHGGLVPEQYWTWLPKFIFNNSHFSSTGGSAPEGYLYAPLFLVEGIVNFLGYFVLSHLFGNKLRHLCEFGDIAFGYLIWYGYTRVFMEPLRDGAYNMGTNGYWSWFWSLVFVAGGAILIVGNHVIRYLIRKHKGTLHAKASWKRSGLIGTLVVGVISAALIVTAAILMTKNEFTGTINYDGFNVGLIFLVTGISVLLGLGISIPRFVEGLKVENE